MNVLKIKSTSYWVGHYFVYYYYNLFDVDMNQKADWIAVFLPLFHQSMKNERMFTLKPDNIVLLDIINIYFEAFIYFML